MEPIDHDMCALFAQLGLPATPEDIAAFIAVHRPLPGQLRLEDAPFWTPAQARLLREELAEDADWAELVDQLNAALR